MHRVNATIRERTLSDTSGGLPERGRSVNPSTPNRSYRSNHLYTVGFDGEAKIKRSDFGISYGLPLLGDEVTLHLEAEFLAKPVAQPKAGA